MSGRTVGRSWGTADDLDLTALARATGVLIDRRRLAMTEDQLCNHCSHLLDQHSLGSGHCTARHCGCPRAKRPGVVARAWARVKAWWVEDSPTDPPLTRQAIRDGAPTNIYAARIERLLDDVEVAR